MVEGPGDDRLSRDCAIMGPAGLTAVFGMGTGVAPPAWSPGKRAAGDSRPDARGCDSAVGRTVLHLQLDSITIPSSRIGESL